jgi:hypothetical protein
MGYPEAVGTPVQQEFYGLLMAHFAVRALMHEAALRTDQDPDMLSFLHAVRVVERRTPRLVAIPPAADDPDRCAATSKNALRIQFWTVLIALLLLKWLHHLSKANWPFSNLAMAPRFQFSSQ